MSTRGERMIEAMEIRGMRKQHALAYALGVNESTVTRWKRNGPMSLDSAISLCRVLDISLDWFLVGYGTIDRHTLRPEVPSVDERLWSTFSKVGSSMSARSKSLLIAFMDSMLSR